MLAQTLCQERHHEVSYLLPYFHFIDVALVHPRLVGLFLVPKDRAWFYVTVHGFKTAEALL